MQRFLVSCMFAASVCLVVACSSGVTRPEYGAVSAIIVKRCRSTVRITDAERVQAIVREVNSIRGKGWEFVRGKPGAHSLMLSLLEHGQVVAELLIDKDFIVEFKKPGMQHSGFIRYFSLNKLPVINRLRQETTGSCSEK